MLELFLIGEAFSLHLIHITDNDECFRVYLCNDMIQFRELFFTTTIMITGLLVRV